MDDDVRPEEPTDTPNPRVLCRTDEIEDPGSLGFEPEQTGLPWSLFLVHKDGELFAYRNNCPHTGAPLDWMPHRFLDLDGAFIQCAIHGALFAIDDGVCLRGPCVEQALQPVPIRIHQGRVMLDVEAPEP